MDGSTSGVSLLLENSMSTAREQETISLQPQSATPTQLGETVVDAGTEQQLRKVLANHGTPADIADLIRQNPRMTDGVFAFIHKNLGNSYAQQVLQALDAKPATADHATDASGKTGSPYASNAFASNKQKDPAATLSSRMTADEHNRAIQGTDANAHSGDEFHRDTAMAAQQNAGQYWAAPGFPIPVRAAPGAAPLVNPTVGENQDGVRIVDGRSTVAGPGTSTDSKMTKVVVSDPFFGNLAPDANKEQKAATLRAYRAAVTAAIDDPQELKLFDKLKTPEAKTEPPSSTPSREEQLVAASKLSPAAAHAELSAHAKKLKENVKTASMEELRKIVADEKLIVVAPELVKYSEADTTTRTRNAAGLLDGSTIAGKSRSVSTLTVDDSGAGHGESRERSLLASTKGVTGSVSHSVSDTDPTKGTASSSQHKTSATLGITEPSSVTYNYKRTTAEAEAGTGHSIDASGGAKFGDGKGVLAGWLKVGAVDAPAKDGATAESKDRPSGSVAVHAGVTQGADGSGLTAAVSDLRYDRGDKKISAGFYGAVDGSVSVLVTPTADGGAIVKFTASSRGKLGVFANKRDAETPVTEGHDVSAGGGYGVGRNHLVTRTKTLTKEEAVVALGQLDALSSGRSPDGKATFGVEASVLAYKNIFHGNLRDLVSGNVEAGSNESVSVADETTLGADLKAGGSTGDANARSSVGGSLSVEHADLSSHSESNKDGILTRKILVGSRQKWNGEASGGIGVASMKAGYGESNEHTVTYVFHVATSDTVLTAELRAIKTDDQARAFAKAHPANVDGRVIGDVNAETSTVGATVGPVAAEIGTTSTLDSNVAMGSHTAVGPDGKSRQVNDLSGSISGKQEGKASVSLLGVKLYDEKTTAEGKGTTDADGQTSLDVTTSTSANSVQDNAAKNIDDLKATKASDRAMLVATGGLTGVAKRLAERVGEQSTFGAHFDPAAFETIVAMAGDHGEWMKAAGGKFRSEWSTLGYALVNPHPPTEWTAHDDSENKIASNQLARVKAFAIYVKEAGPEGQRTIARLRGEYTDNAVGITQAFPPSLQSERAGFDTLASQVEHLKTAMASYANAGDEAGGTEYLNKLVASLTTLRGKVSAAQDFENPRLAIRFGEGLGTMQQTVESFRVNFAAALKAHAENKPASAVTAALAPKEAESTRLFKLRNPTEKDPKSNRPEVNVAVLDHTQHEHDKAKHDALTAEQEETQAAKKPASHDNDANWFAAYQKATSAKQKEQDAKKAFDAQAPARALYEQENKARAEEEIAAARAKLPSLEAACKESHGRSAGLAAAANYLLKDRWTSNSTAFAKIDAIGGVMNEWNQQWQHLRNAYKALGDEGATREAAMATVYRPHLGGNDWSEIVANAGKFVTAQEGWIRDLAKRWS
jgi:hypothetical protein